MSGKVNWWKAYALLAIFIGFAPIQSPACAQDFPQKQVRILVGFAPGGGNDTIARLIAPILSEKWGKPVIVENREGADGTIAADIVAKSPPDGQTLLMMNTNQSSTPALRKLPFDPVKDFAFISVIAAAPEVLLVHPSFEAKSVQEFITLAKANPSKINFGSAGQGSPPFLEMARFMNASGISLTPITYKGSAAAMPALLGGEIQVMFQNSLIASASVGNDSLRALAITGKERSKAIPTVPTFDEAAGITVMNDLVSWYGLAAPNGTPAEVVDKIYNDVVEAVRSPKVTKVLTDGGSVIVLSTPEETRKKVVSEIDEFAQLMATYKDK